MAPVQQKKPDPTHDAASRETLIAFLKSGEAFQDTAVDVVETHMSYIFLTSTRAYKLKKPIKLPFADFSTAELRRSACERELEVNRMYPSGIYLGVRPVTKSGQGFAIDGDGERVDWLVEMKRFDRDFELDKLVKRGALEPTHIDQLADLIAEQHQEAAFVSQAGVGQPILVTAENVGKTLADLSSGTALAGPVADWRYSISRALHLKAAKLDSRRRHGFVKRCHGDLHLANICLFDDRPIPFDAIEFSEELATIDVLYDAAFPIMDLLHHGKQRLANQFMNRYLSATQDYCGTELLGLFISLRAAVRAMTALLANKPEQDKSSDATAHIALANSLLKESRKPSLIAIGGLSGTGKSSLARELAPEIAPGAGAILLRSDVIRKRMAGIEPERELPASAYSRRNGERVYERMLKLARHALNAGQTVIADAVFLEPREREEASVLASKAGVPFHGLWLEVKDLKLLESRIEKRTGDASDATTTVLKAQSRENSGQIDWHHVDASPSTDQVKSHCIDLIKTVSPARWPESVEFG